MGINPKTRRALASRESINRIVSQHLDDRYGNTRCLFEDAEGKLQAFLVNYDGKINGYYCVLGEYVGDVQS